MFAEALNLLPMPFVALASKPEELALMSSRSTLPRHGEPYPDVSHGAVTIERGGFARHRTNWDQRNWDWDHVGFVAHPAARGFAVENNGESPPTASYEDSGGHGETSEVQGLAPNLFDGGSREPRIEQEFLSPRDSVSPEVSGGLDLKLGGSSFSAAGEDGGGTSRNSKRYRPSSPGAQFPSCQVDDCKADLRLSKDYHRRHKVCESHSKAAKAQVAHQLQRFCQQCSRFHPLAEFDEGKRSCRRRLAGHNRRRRKTQPDAAAAQAYLLAETDYSASKAGFLSFLQLLTQLQASSPLEGLNGLNGFVNNKEALLQYYRRSCAPCMPEENNVEHLPHQVNGHSNGNGEATGSKSSPHQLENGYRLAEKQLLSSALTGPVQEKLSLLLQSNGHKNAPKDLFAQATREGSSSILSLAPGGRPDAMDQRSPVSAQQSNGRPVASPPSAGAASDVADPSSTATMARQSAEAFSDPSRSWSKPTPVAHKLFPLQSCTGSRVAMNGTLDGDAAVRPMLPYLEGQSAIFQGDGSPFLRRTMDVQQVSGQKLSETSTSGSDLSPEGSNADSQELLRRHCHQETLMGRISFKLFDKMPGDFPQILRNQIQEWLARTPSDMESYIRPGCVILTVFLCMPAHAWEDLCRGMPWRLQSLFETSSEFWNKGRIQVQVEGQTVYIVNGKLQLHRVLRPLCPPHVQSIRPLAFPTNCRTRLVLSGYNLTSRTRILCSFQGKCGSACLEPATESEKFVGAPRFQQLQEKFAFDCGPYPSYGRCVLEVEHNTSKGNSLPVLVVDSAVCAEIRTLEDEIDDVTTKAAQVAEGRGLLPDEVSEFSYTARMGVEAEVTKFLLELGWLMQRKTFLSTGGPVCWSGSSRIETLLFYSVDRDWCAVVKLLLDLYFSAAYENIADTSSILSIEAFAGGNSLLHRAVTRNCRSMAELLLAYSARLPTSPAGRLDPSVSLDMDTLHDQMVIFTPDMAGRNGITPLHIAASMQNAEGAINALISDPGQRGIHAWSHARDANGQTPLNCAIAGGKFLYIQLVRSKEALLRSGTLSRPPNAPMADLVGHQGHQITAGRADMKLSPSLGGRKTQCGLPGLGRAHGGVVRGQAYRPFLLCMVAVACVCVVVCVCFRSPPPVGFVVPPFTWGSLGAGPK